MNHMTNGHHPDCADPELSAFQVGVQEAPAQPQPAATPQQIEEADLLRYQLFTAKVELAQLKVDMYRRESQRALIELSEIGRTAAEHMRSVETKYKIDLRTQMLTDDGYIVPRQPRKTQ